MPTDITLHRQRSPTTEVRSVHGNVYIVTAMNQWERWDMLIMCNWEFFLYVGIFVGVYIKNNCKYLLLGKMYFAAKHHEAVTTLYTFKI